jgi:hypothetical protein
MLGGESTLYFLQEAKNDYIAEFCNKRMTTPSTKVGGKPDGRQIGPRLPAGGFVRDHELAALFYIQFFDVLLSMYLEQQPDTGLGLGIILQVMTC